MVNTPPNTSRQRAIDFFSDEDLLNVKDEKAEITRLELTASNSTQAEATVSTVDDERIAKVTFHCANCNLHEMVHYFGKNPNFMKGVEFLEDTYIMRDPFQPPPQRWKTKPEYFIAIGGDCIDCKNTVCKDTLCSFYYTHTYCVACALNRIKTFPVEVQFKLRKQLAAIKKA